MVEQTKKTAVKKVAPVKSKATKTESAPAAKKAVPKKTKAAASESAKPKSPAAKTATPPVAKAPSKRAATSKAKPQPAENKTAVLPTPEERYRMVETAAYFIAEQHGFQGRSDEHWAAAERAIAAKLGE
jgi:hypothetical protein